MNPTEPSCPSPEALADLQANALGAADAAQLRAHIASCPACRAALQRPAASGASAPAPRRDPPTRPEERLPTELNFLAPTGGPGEVTFGPYKVKGILGEGGMAYVLDAEDSQLHRAVALKVLKPTVAADESLRQRFLREARIIAALPHDHIVTVFAVGEERGVPFIALERLSGVSLEGRLKRDRWLPVAEALSIARQVAEGLAVAHEKGLVHRDIKPANIWLETSPRGTSGGLSGEYRVKILDFGVARLTFEQATLTAPGQVIGTPAYMAPEQATGGPIDERADLYALGCVLYRMLTGRPPFEDGLDTVALLQAIIRQEPVPVAELVPQLPVPVAQLISDLLAKDPNDRPPSARAVVARIRSAQDGEPGRLPVSAPALVSATAPPAKPRRIGWGVWAGAGTVLLAVLLVLAYLVEHFLNPAEPSGDPNGKGAALAGKEPIKIGVLHSLTGTLAISERPLREAAEQAVAEINDAGGVLGRPLEVVVEDGESKEEVFAERARDLLVEKKVAAIVGCWSSGSRKRVAAVCEKHDGLLLYPTPYEGLEEFRSVFYLGGCPNHTLLPMARYAVKELGKKRFYLVGSETVYSRVAHAILKDELARLGVSVAGESFALLGERKFAETAKKVESAKADMVLNTLDGQSIVAYFHAVRDAGLTAEKVPTAWFNVSEIELQDLDGEEMVGDYTAWSYFESIDRKENREFLASFRKRYGAKRVNDPMQTEYVAVHLWKKAVEEAGSQAVKDVRPALKKQTMDAPSELMRIAANQHAWRMARVGRIEPGRTIRVVWASPEPLPPRPFPDSRTREQWKKLLDDLYRGWGDRWEKHVR